MAISLPVLDSIVIASPCTVPWEGMQGDERVRFCTKCSQQVFDVSEMTTAEAVQLLADPGKSTCVRIHRRADGRVMTADCPMSVRERIWKRLRRRSAWAASLFAILFLSGCRDDGRKTLHGGTCPSTANPTEKSSPKGGTER